MSKIIRKFARKFVQRQQRKKKTENNNYGKEGIELERYDGEMVQ